MLVWFHLILQIQDFTDSRIDYLKQLYIMVHVFLEPFLCSPSFNVVTE